DGAGAGGWSCTKGAGLVSTSVRTAWRASRRVVSTVPLTASATVPLRFSHRPSRIWSSRSSWLASVRRTGPLLFTFIVMEGFSVEGGVGARSPRRGPPRVISLRARFGAVADPADEVEEVDQAEAGGHQGSDPEGGAAESGQPGRQRRQHQQPARPPPPVGALPGIVRPLWLLVGTGLVVEEVPVVRVVAVEALVIEVLAVSQALALP